MSKILSGVMGHALGDAMGVPVEFIPRRELSFNPVTDMRGKGSHPVPKGYWSDDTSMEIALMDSFIEKGKFDYDDIMNKFSELVNFGKYTPVGEVFDIGRTCLQAIRNYIKGEYKATECGLDTVNANGNGSLMRILPVAYYCYYNKLEANEIFSLVKDISSLTHRHEISVLGCYIYINYVIFLLEENDKFEAYDKVKNIDYSMFSKESLDVYFRVLKEDINKVNIDDIKSSGYVVDTLEACLWVILNTESFKEAILNAVNLGNDTDTIGAITGSIAGIIYGYESIPNEWLESLAKREYLENLCNDFEKAVK